MPLTNMPATATHRMVENSTGCGSDSRLIDSQAIAPTATSNSRRPLTGENLHCRGSRPSGAGISASETTSRRQAWKSRARHAFYRKTPRCDGADASRTNDDRGSPASHGTSASLPTVLRLSRSACARAASASAYCPPECTVSGGLTMS